MLSNFIKARFLRRLMPKSTNCIATARIHSKPSQLDTQTITIKLKIKKQNSVDKHVEFCEKLGITFSDKNLIHQVCTHKSVRSNTAPTNERLDFLGQKVISLYATEYLFNQVKPSELHDHVYLYTKRSLNIGKIVIEAEKNGQNLQSSGEESVTGRALQALVGAIYHDQGAYAAKQFVHKHILSAPMEL
ncbi:14271_t:CDS:2, partial [Dentiscutata heterogama]